MKLLYITHTTDANLLCVELVAQFKMQPEDESTATLVWAAQAELTEYRLAGEHTVTWVSLKSPSADDDNGVPDLSLARKLAGIELCWLPLLRHIETWAQYDRPEASATIKLGQQQALWDWTIKSNIRRWTNEAEAAADAARDEGEQRRRKHIKQIAPAPEHIIHQPQLADVIGQYVYDSGFGYGKITDFANISSELAASRVLVRWQSAPDGEHYLDRLLFVHERALTEHNITDDDLLEITE